MGYVWPEPTSSAAGSRILSLAQCFLKAGYRILFASAAQTTENSQDLKDLGLSARAILLNHESFNRSLKEWKPDIVVFDRFITEEQYGFRVQSVCPNALRIIDTEDFHSLREARRLILKENGEEFPLDALLDENRLIGKMQETELCYREIASYTRSDLNLMISDFESYLLQKFFKFSEQKIHTIPFLSQENARGPAFEERRDFVSIGSFRHAPNVDACLWLCRTLWPEIRKKLPKASLNLYGSYITPQMSQLHSPENGIFMRGRAYSAHEVLRHSRVLLAPLRFGAGQKGKILDALQTKTPYVTTPIGTEGMQNQAGVEVRNAGDFVKQAILLYENQKLWNSFHQAASSEFERLFSFEDHQKSLIKRISFLQENLLKHRKTGFMERMLNFHSSRASRFMSQWIEEKNAKS